MSILRVDILGSLKLNGIFDKVIRKARSLEKKIESINKTGDKFSKVGRRMSVASGAVAIGVASVISTFSGYEDSMLRVQALSGATEQQFQQLEEQSQKLGATTRFSAKEAADGMGFFAQAGFETHEILKAMPATLNLASALTTDLAETADIASNVMGGFGIKASDFSSAADMITATATASNTDLTQLGEAFSEVGPIAKMAGVSFEETAGIIGFLGNAGIQASRAGTSLKNILINLVKPTPEAIKAFQELGIAKSDIFKEDGTLKSFSSFIDKIRDSGISLEKTTTIFKKLGVTGFSVLMEQGGDALEQFTNQIKNSEGTTERLSNIMESGLGGALRSLNSQFQAVKIQLFDNNQGFKEWIQKIAGGLGVFAEFLKNNEWLANSILVLSGIVIVAGPIVLTLAAAFKTLAAVMGVVNVVMNLNPIGLITLGVIALAAAITTIIIKYDKWGAAISLALGPLGLMLNTIMSFKKNWTEIVKAFEEGGILKGIQMIGATLFDSILMPVQQLLELVSKIPGVEVASTGANRIEALRKKLGVYREPIQTAKDNKGSAFHSSEEGHPSFTSSPNIRHPDIDKPSLHRSQSDVRVIVESKDGTPTKVVSKSDDPNFSVENLNLGFAGGSMGDL